MQADFVIFKKLFSYCQLFFYFSNDAQTISTLKYNNIPGIKNADSVLQNTPYKNQVLLNHLLTINKSRVSLRYKKDIALFRACLK